MFVCHLCVLLCSTGTSLFQWELGKQNRAQPFHLSRGVSRQNVPSTVEEEGLFVILNVQSVSMSVIFHIDMNVYPG